VADRIVIETPEQISLELPLAGIGSRSLALALDTLIQVAAGLALFVIWISFRAPGLGCSSGGANPGSAWTAALLVLAAFLLQFGYFAYFEAIWNGQTPGKRYLRLRVIRRGGQPISAYEAVTRNLLRIVDSIPVIYAVGILCALLSPQSKRLGDYVAGTVVVHERPIELTTEANGTSAGPEPAMTELPAGVQLATDEFLLVETFFARRHQLTPEVRAQAARQIVERLANRLGIPPQDRKSPEALLESLARSYRLTPGP
jgi:uncharacterized RDD family membrane protein YckC